jgi:hypothetical protein
LLPKKEKQKSKSDCNGVWKRVTGGFFCLSIFVLLYYCGQFTMASFYIPISVAIFKELTSITRNERLDQISGQKTYELIVYLVFAQLAMLPKGILHWRYLQGSGVYEEEYPLLYALLFRYNVVYMIVASILIFWWTVYRLDAKTCRYQMNQIGAGILVIMICIITGPELSTTASFGRFWLFVPLIST